MMDSHVTATGQDSVPGAESKDSFQTKRKKLINQKKKKNREISSIHEADLARI